MNVLIHDGQKGMRWGVRRYQNKDGTWTEFGKERRRQIRASIKAEDKAVSTIHREEKQLRSSSDEIARTGEYWYNQHGEIQSTVISKVDGRHPRVLMPNAVLEYLENSMGYKQVNRILYDGQAIIAKEIHAGPHGSPSHFKRNLPDGAHVHEHDETGIRFGGNKGPGTHERPLNDSERFENRDIIQKTEPYRQTKRVKKSR